MMEELRIRIEENSIPEPNSGCWIWERSCFPNGYGQTKVKRQGMGAHRVSWMAFRGPIPDGLQVLHKCDNRACVNPQHLFIGTHKDNMEDRTAKGRTHRPFGELQGGHKLCEEDVIRILEEPGPVTMDRAREMGKEFGIHHLHVYRIRRGDRWPHVRKATK